MLISKKALPAVVATFLLLLPNPTISNAQAPSENPGFGDSAVSTSQSVASDSETETRFIGAPDGEQRKLTTTEDGGIHFDIQEDDKLEVQGSKIFLTDNKGTELLEMEAKLPEGAVLEFDQETHTVTPTFEGPVLQCSKNKWVKWGFNAAWDGLVCFPASVGASPGGPVAVGGAAVVCHAAGDGLATAMTC